MAICGWASTMRCKSVVPERAQPMRNTNGSMARDLFLSCGNHNSSQPAGSRCSCARISCTMNNGSGVAMAGYPLRAIRGDTMGGKCLFQHARQVHDSIDIHTMSDAARWFEISAQPGAEGLGTQFIGVKHIDQAQILQPLGP